MKKVIVILSLMLTFAGLSNVMAQGKGKGKGKGAASGSNKGQAKSVEEISQNRSQFWKKELGLTDDQTSQLKTAIADRVTKVRQAKTNADKAAKKSAIDAAKSEFDTKVQSILSPEQYTKFKAKKEEMKKAKEAKKSTKPEDTDDEEQE